VNEKSTINPEILEPFLNKPVKLGVANFFVPELPFYYYGYILKADEHWVTFKDHKDRIQLIKIDTILDLFTIKPEDVGKKSKNKKKNNLKNSNSRGGTK